MPRDKSATHERLIPIIKAEFLEFGYEKASLQHIASQAGITAAGLYRHFPGKEAMFSSLVEPTLKDFLEFWDNSISDAIHMMNEKNFPEAFQEFRQRNNRDLMNFVYDNYDALKLLLTKARGTRYENFEEEIVEKEVETIKSFFKILDKKGIEHSHVKENEMHILSTTLIAAITEAVKHDYTRKQALKHLDFVSRLLTPGIKDILGF